MPAAVTLVRSTYTDADSFNAAAFNALTASSASVPDATPGTAGVMPGATTAAGLAMIAASDVTAQRALLSLSSMALQAAGAVAITGGTIAATPISGSTGAFTTVTASSTIAATGAVTGSNLSGTNTGDQTITLTGGVTGSGTGSFAVTVVTNANLTGAITSVGNATSLGSFSSANLASALTDETGSGANVFATSPTLVTPILGTPQSGTLTSCTGLPISTGVSGLGTGVATALAVNVGSAGAPVVNGGALGTPSSGTVTNLTGTAAININGTVGATTPSTGAFTTVSASGVITQTIANSGYINVNTDASNKQWRVGGGSGGIFQITEVGVADRLTLTSTGLAVTGALSATTAGRFGTTSAVIHSTESLTAFASSGVTVGFACDAAASWPLSLWHKGTGTKDLAVFYSNDGGSFGLRGKIQTDGTGVSLISSSDERLKTNFRPITNSGAIIDALAPSLFDWLSGQKDTYGFGAQSTYQVFPQAVAKGDDSSTDITDQWGMDVSKLVPVLTAELQSLRARVAALESK